VRHLNFRKQLTVTPHDFGQLRGQELQARLCSTRYSEMWCRMVQGTATKSQWLYDDYTIALDSGLTCANEYTQNKSRPREEIISKNNCSPYSVDSLLSGLAPFIDS
jgi:hypothetical protein